MKTQSTTATDCRCKACGALLAKRDRDGPLDAAPQGRQVGQAVAVRGQVLVLLAQNPADEAQVIDYARCSNSSIHSTIESICGRNEGSGWRSSCVTRCDSSMARSAAAMASTSISSGA